MSQEVTARFIRQFAVPLLITAAIALAVGVTWKQSDRRVDKEMQDAFDRYSVGVADKVEERVHGHAQLLRAGAGLWAANPQVTREQWRRFVELLGLDQTYPGVQGLGFALRIAPEQLAAHQRSLRRQGFPDYVVKPEGARDAYSAIIYLEPFAGRNLRAFGYDMGSDGVRREAM
jgi:CHASE1-domain containing sensor protein